MKQLLATFVAAFVLASAATANSLSMGYTSWTDSAAFMPVLKAKHESMTEPTSMTWNAPAHTDVWKDGIQFVRGDRSKDLLSPSGSKKKAWEMEVSDPTLEAKVESEVRAFAIAWTEREMSDLWESGVQYARGDRSKNLWLASAVKNAWSAETILPPGNYMIGTCSWHSMPLETCAAELVEQEFARGDRSKLLIGDMMSYAMHYDAQETVKGDTVLNSLTAEYSAVLASMDPWMK